MDVDVSFPAKKGCPFILVGAVLYILYIDVKHVVVSIFEVVPVISAK